MKRRTHITGLERLQLMFSAGNDIATTKGNGSGIPGLFPAMNRGWVEVVGKFGKPTTWRITEAGKFALSNQSDRGSDEA